MYLPIPAPLLRGLFGFMDEQDEEDEQSEPRGLFGHFAGEFGEDRPGTAAAASGSNASHADSSNGPPQDEISDETPGYWQRQLNMAFRQILTNPLGVQPVTRNPVTGEINVVPYLKSVGDRYSATMPTPFPSGRVPPRPRSAPVTTVTRPAPGFLFEGPQAQTAENEVYSVPSGEDSEEDERPDPCLEQYEEDMDECSERYGYHPDIYRRCTGRAAIRLAQCQKGEPRMHRWNEVDIDGVRHPRVPWPKKKKR